MCVTYQRTWNHLSLVDVVVVVVDVVSSFLSLHIFSLFRASSIAIGGSIFETYLSLPPSSEPCIQQQHNPICPMPFLSRSCCFFPFFFFFFLKRRNHQIEPPCADLFTRAWAEAVTRNELHQQPENHLIPRINLELSYFIGFKNCT